MTLSFNKLNEIAALYESIAASEQEQLDEKDLYSGTRTSPTKTQQVQGTRTALNRGKSIGLASNEFGQNVGSLKLNSAETKKSGRSTLNITPDKNTKPYMNKDAVYGNKRVVGGDTYYRATLKGKDVFVSGNKATKKPVPDTDTKTDPKPQPKPDPKTPITAKPQPKVTPTKPAGSAMDQWAKANPKLAAAKAERDRTRGTSATTNPLMNDTKANLPAPAPKSAPPSSTLKSATDAASKPSAFKPATTAVASSTTDKGVVPATNAIAAKPKPVTPNPSATSTKPGDGKPYKDGPLWDSYQYDAYDLVLEYLLSQGHAETVAEAQYLMTEMDAEMIGDIVEGAAGAYVPNSIDRSNSDRDMLRRQGVKNVSPNIPGPSGGGQFEKPSSNPAGVLRLAKTSSKSDTKTA